MAFLSDTYEAAVTRTAQQLDWARAEELVVELRALRERGGRLFLLGLGGSAGNASHMTNDMRKLAGIETYAVTDNVSELTARINDDGWGNAFTGWLKASRLGPQDAILVLSVGGGDAARGAVPLHLLHRDRAHDRGRGEAGGDGGVRGRSVS